ncbi:hypothetical protein M408DRAFT_334149 [Serendipita vermifera MAFF 305830]|uniref:Uncharacterized protein n=1 Tax=Serendipita vermifera MAFF 305830 TaxID=933852 RepID=A0A0C3A5X9_SERVB|nr:hypothetical protein M408DRAFT_334149 [Serendipita vermifera MAFF 305830]
MKAPIYSFRDDFDKVSKLGMHFCDFGEGLHVWLRDDLKFKRLKDTLKRFNVHGSYSKGNTESPHLCSGCIHTPLNTDRIRLIWWIGKDESPIAKE